MASCVSERPESHLLTSSRFSERYGICTSWRRTATSTSLMSAQNSIRVLSSSISCSCERDSERDVRSRECKNETSHREGDRVENTRIYSSPPATAENLDERRPAAERLEWTGFRSPSLQVG